MQDDKIKQLLTLAGELSTAVLDKQIEYHSQQLDQLRLLKQIVAIREESSFIGVWTGPTENTVENPIEKQQPENNRSLETETKTSKEPCEKTQKYQRSYFPVEGTHAWKVYEILKEHGELPHSEISRKAGLAQGSLGTVFRVWIKNGLFVKTGWGKYRLADKKDQIQEEPVLITPSTLNTAEATNEEPLNGDAFRVRAYLQRMQPSKPMIISADLNIPLDNVVSILQQHVCFQIDEKGWRLKAAKSKEENPHRCLA